jgi:hypothetical protein
LSDSVAREAEHEAITIATGLSRPEVEQRARRAFESANDIRARLRGLPDTAKRAQAVSRARTWAEILQHMDATGEPEFCGCLHDSTPPVVVRAVWIGWDWLARMAWPLNVAALARGFLDVLGAKPITFYEWPESPPGIGPATAARAAGASTAPPMPGVGDASSSGGLQQSGCGFLSLLVIAVMVALGGEGCIRRPSLSSGGAHGQVHPVTPPGAGDGQLRSRELRLPGRRAGDVLWAWPKPGC